MKIATRQFLFLWILACSMHNQAFTQSGNQNKNATNKMHVVSFSVFERATKVDKGFWTATVDGTKTCIQLMNSQKNAPHYIITNCFSKNDIKSSDDQAENSEIRRLAGTLTFVGDVLKNNGSGTFVFSRDTAFESSLKKLGIDVSDELYYFKLFLGDIQMSYITGIKDLGYEPNLREIGRLAYHDAGLDYIRQISNAFTASPDLEMISKLAANGVSLSYVKSLTELGYTDLQPEMAKKLSALDVDANYIKSFQNLDFAKLELESIKKAKAHKLTADYIVKERKKGNNFERLHDYIRLKSRQKKS